MTSLRPDVLLLSITIGLVTIALHMPCVALAGPAVAMANVAACSSFASIGGAAATFVSAAVPAFAVPPALPPGGSYTPLGDAMRIQGQPVSAWLFDAPGSLADTASWLTKRQPALRDLWVMPGAVVLAGIADGMHWVARLVDAGENRTRGTVSVLPVSGGARSGDGHGARDPDATRATATLAGRDRATSEVDPGWRLNGGQLHFDLRSRDKDAVIIEQIWTHAAPPVNLSKKLHNDLAADGWRSMGMDATSMAAGTDAIGTRHAINYWLRGGTTLSMIIVPLAQGSGVTAVLRIGT